MGAVLLHRRGASTEGASIEPDRPLPHAGGRPPAGASLGMSEQGRPHVPTSGLTVDRRRPSGQRSARTGGPAFAGGTSGRQVAAREPPRPLRADGVDPDRSHARRDTFLDLYERPHRLERVIPDREAPPVIHAGGLRGGAAPLRHAGLADRAALPAGIVDPAAFEARAGDVVIDGSMPHAGRRRGRHRERAHGRGAITGGAPSVGRGRPPQPRPSVVSAPLRRRGAARARPARRGLEGGGPPRRQGPSWANTAS